MGYKRKIANLVGYCQPLIRGFEMMNRSPRIIFYHGVENKPLINTKVQANQMLFHNFERQILYLKKHYNILSIDELLDKIKRKQMSSKDIVITFDDGYRNNYLVAAPLLKSLSLPFTIFIPTKLINNQERIPTFYVRAVIFHMGIKTLDIPSIQKKIIFHSEQDRDIANRLIINYIKTESNDVVKKIIDDILANISKEQKQEIYDWYSSEDLMSWEEIRAISGMGATIGSHCLDHSILHANQAKEEIMRQLLDSKNAIECMLHECNYFAFPNGDMNSVCPYAIEMARKIYKASFIVDGKSINKSVDWAKISRIGACEDFYAFKSQLSILSL